MRIVIALILLAAMGAPAHAETITATVKGMVCAFCATGIEKTFQKQAAVQDVKVDLAAKLLTVHTRDGQTLDDATIRKLVTAAGYGVTEIKHQ